MAKVHTPLTTGFNNQVVTPTPSNAVVTGATLKGPLLTKTGAFNYAAVNQWLATHAGGS